MLIKRRFFKKVTSLLLVFLFALPIQPVLASEQSIPNIELTLAVGNSDVDVSSFVYDVQTAVYQKYGITSDKLKITKAGATIVDSKNDFNWTIYDHYYSPDYPEDGSVPVDWSVYHSSNQPYSYYEEGYLIDSTKFFTDVSFNDESMMNCYKRSKHIYPKDDGLVFVGYSEPAYKDFMLYPEQNASEKTIEFKIDESGVRNHTLEGAGFLFNASIQGDNLNGYLIFYNYLSSTTDLYKLTNVDAKAFHNEENYDISALQIPGIQRIASKEWGSNESVQDIKGLAAKLVENAQENKEDDASNRERAKAQTFTAREINSSNQIKNIKVKVTSNSLKFYEDNVEIYDTTGIDSNIAIEDTGAGGFGPLVSYRSHYCEMLSYFTFTDLTMETYRSLTFLDLINQQTWGENTKRFLINLDDDGVPEFSNDGDVAKVAAHMNNFGVHYIGWGRNSQIETVASAVYNKDQADDFISLIDGKGIFINRDDPNYDTYTKGIDKIAEYIYSQIKSTSSGTHHSSGGGGTAIEPEQPEPVITFKDIIGHWAQKDIEQLVALKLINGYPDGTFKPDYTVTRAEFATMLSKVFDYVGLKYTEGVRTPFADVAENEWYYQSINKMAQEGILFGYGNGTFGPNKQITREEAAAMLTRMLIRADAEMQGSELQFEDADKISPWAKTPLERITPLEIIQGMPDGNFYPQDNSTRAQAVAMILRMLEKAKL